MDEYLINTSITEFNNNFEIKQNIISEKVNVKDFRWILTNSITTASDNSSTFQKKSYFQSNFNIEIITNSFSDLSSLTYFQLKN